MTKPRNKEYIRKISELVDEYTPSEIVKITNIPKGTVYRILGRENWDMCNLCKLRLSKGKCEVCRDKRSKKHSTRTWKTSGIISDARNAVINHFSNGSNSCACCGENNVKFLTISHKNNDGAKHRREGFSLYRLIKNNYKTDYELIIECYNCNLSRSRNGGVCPHETVKV